MAAPSFHPLGRHRRRWSPRPPARRAGPAGARTVDPTADAPAPWVLALLAGLAGCVSPEETSARDLLVSGDGEPIEASAAEPSSASTSSGTPADGVPVRGSVRARYRGRWEEDDEDHELYATLSMVVGDPERHAVTAHFSGRGYARLGPDDDAFTSLPDTRDGDVSGTLYYGYLDFHRLETFSTLRAGRQQLWDTPVLAVLDGALAEVEERDGTRVGGYAGRRARYYDRSGTDDLVAGAFVETRPWAGGRFRLDYMHLEDEARLGSDQDDLFGLGLWQLLTDELTLEAKGTVLEGDARDLSLRSLWADDESRTTLQATYYELFRAQGNRAYELNPYYDSLSTYYPFRQIGVLASRDVGETVAVTLGLDTRWLDDRDDVGEFNHEFERYYLTTLFQDTLVEGLDLTLTGDVWDDDQQDLQTWGLDLTRRFDDGLTGSLGSYYSLYKYDLFQNSERDHVRTYYARLRLPVGASTSLDLAYELEDLDFGTYHALTLATTWRF